MSSISQTIPSYVAGISEQPDQLKLTGQVKDCVNALPDVTRMLGKRPGCEFLREDTGANAHLGHWFDIYRDPNEQYIGVVRPTTTANNRGGQIDVFRVVPAPLLTYNNNAGTAEVQSREYVVVTNHGSGFTPGTSTNVATTNTTDGAATGLTVDVTVNAAGLVSLVRINRVGDPAANAYEHGDVITITGFAGAQITYFTGLAGEQVNVKYDDVAHSIVDLNTAGTIAPTTADTECGYLIHTDSDRIKSLTINDTTAFVNRDTVTAMTADTEPAPEAEGFAIITTLAFNQVYRFNLIRGATVDPVISAATNATSATVEALLQDLQTKVQAISGYTADIIGNGLHITRADGVIFSMETTERQIMNVFTDEVQDITLLPDQCHHRGEHGDGQPRRAPIVRSRGAHAAACRSECATVGEAVRAAARPVAVGDVLADRIRPLLLRLRVSPVPALLRSHCRRRPCDAERRRHARDVGHPTVDAHRRRPRSATVLARRDHAARRSQLGACDQRAQLLVRPHRRGRARGHPHALRPRPGGLRCRRRRDQQRLARVCPPRWVLHRPRVHPRGEAGVQPDVGARRHRPPLARDRRAARRHRRGRGHRRHRAPHRRSRGGCAAVESPFQRELPKRVEQCAGQPGGSG